MSEILHEDLRAIVREEIAHLGVGHVSGLAQELTDRLRTDDRPSLRDHFAGLALVGLLTHHRDGVPELFAGVGTMPGDSVSDGIRRCARLSYEIADAMLEAR